jgi:hypothetical protein
VIETVALCIVVGVGLFFISLGATSLVAPLRVSRFLLGFAGSAAKHYTELMVRFLVGGAFVLATPRVLAPGFFSAFGWIVLVTTACLLPIPWQWHHRFARRAVPEALRFLPLVGVSSVAVGALVLWAVFRGNAA